MNHSRQKFPARRFHRTLVVTLLACALSAGSVSAGKVSKRTTTPPGSAPRSSAPHGPVVVKPYIPRGLLPAEAPPVDSNELLHDIGRAPVLQSTRRPLVHRVWMEVTAYCPCTKCCGPNAIGLTASGKHVSYNDGRFVAADTDRLPFGTKLIIPGYGQTSSPVEVIDRGGAIKGNKLDVFFRTHDEALQWGRRRVAVFVVNDVR